MLEMLGLKIAVLLLLFYLLHRLLEHLVILYYVPNNEKNQNTFQTKKRKGNGDGQATKKRFKKKAKMNKNKMTQFNKEKNVLTSKSNVPSELNKNQSTYVVSSSYFS